MRLVSGLLNADQTNRAGNLAPLAWQGHEDALALKLNQLWLSMISASRLAPAKVGLRNSFQHMWGYVSGHSKLSPQTQDLASLASDIQTLAVKHQVSYLMNSTAPGELRAWL